MSGRLDGGSGKNKETLWGEFRREQGDFLEHESGISERITHLNTFQSMITMCRLGCVDGEGHAARCGKLLWYRYWTYGPLVLTLGDCCVSAYLLLRWPNCILGG